MPGRLPPRARGSLQARLRSSGRFRSTSVSENEDVHTLFFILFPEKVFDECDAFRHADTVNIFCVSCLGSYSSLRDLRSKNN